MRNTSGKIILSLAGGLGLLGMALAASLVHFGTLHADPISESAASSSAPTDGEIFSAMFLEEPLVPVGKTSPAENAALVDAANVYCNRQNLDDDSAIASFLSRYPNSPWRVALLTNLGLDYRHTGHFSKALDAWERAWNLGKGATDPRARNITDRALSEFAELNSRLGRQEQLKTLFDQVKTRHVAGSNLTRLDGAKTGLGLMKEDPEHSFRCGPYAVNSILQLTKNPQVDGPVIQNALSTSRGTSLAQVSALAASLGLNYQPAFRSPGSSIQLPAVIHWKLGHFAAILAEKDGRYRISDPTFGYDVLVSQKTIDEEASGWFLIPRAPLAQGWRSVSKEEAATVWGKGNVNGRNPDCTTNCDHQTGPGSCAGCNESAPAPNIAMAGYSVDTMLVSVHVTDTPVGYSPPAGPSVYFTATYNQWEANQPSNFTYSNLGALWTFNWLSYVTIDGSNNASVYMRGGGTHRYAASTFNSGTQTYAPNLQGQATLVKTSSTSYEMHFPDGSKDIYNVPGATGVFFLKQSVDPQNNAVTLTYDSNMRVTQITDALNQVTTISYTHADIYKITRVTDPFGRYATFTYDSNNTSGARLKIIQDVIGITSTFTYDTTYTSQVKTLQTSPYGTTTFNVIPQLQSTTASVNSSTARTLEIVDPNGAKERWENWPDNYNAPAAIPASYSTSSSDFNTSYVPYVPTGGISYFNSYLNARNTYYWDKKEYAATTIPDYTKAEIYHWLHSSSGSESSVLESEKKPLEGRVWYNYPGQTWAAGEGAGNHASVKARVLDDGTTQRSTYAYTPDNSTPTQITGPALDGSNLPVAGRVTNYQYDTNNIDLLRVYQGSDLIASYVDAGGNSAYVNHLPQRVTDAAGKTTQIVYNSRGQVTSVTNPKNETTTYAYGGSVPDGYLATVTGPTFNGVAPIQSFTYDSAKRVRTTTDADGYVITYDYDSLDRITKMTYPDTTYEQLQYTDVNTAAMTLDLTATKDRTNQWTYRHYNKLRKMDWEIDPLGRTTQYYWCLCGALEQIVDPRSTNAIPIVTTFVRDIEGRVMQKLLPDRPSVTNTYENSTSRLKNQVDAKSQRTNYTYYVDNNLKAVTYTDTNGNALNPPTPSVTYTYDTVYDRVTSMTSGTLSTDYGLTTYNYFTAGSQGAGRLEGMDGPWSGGTDVIQYTYDELGRRLKESINTTANTDTVTYDSLGRVSSEVNNLGTFTPTYVGVSPRLDYLTLPNGFVTDYTWLGNTGDKRLQTLQNKTGGGVNITKLDYTYDPAGRILSMTDQLDATNPWKATGYNGANPYDAASQLTTWQTKDTVTGTQKYSYPFSYDTSGNRTSDWLNTSYTPNNLNEIVSRTDLGGTTYPTGYDYNGNRTSEPGVTYEWNAADELSAYNFSNYRYEFSYNGDGHLWQAVKKVGGVVQNTYRYLWIGDQVREQRDSTGTTVLQKYWHNGTIINNGTQLLALRDQLGSVRELINNTSALTIRARYRYPEPYGGFPVKVSGDLDSPFQFAGYFIEPFSNLTFTGHRVYLPAQGRWLNRDPLAEDGGLNLYGYVGNSPLDGIDPAGLFDGSMLHVDGFIAHPNNNPQYPFEDQYRRARAIANQEWMAHKGHNTTEDAFRHANWCRRMTEEIDPLTAFLAGTGHELESTWNGTFNLNESLMDLHNNWVGIQSGLSGSDISLYDLVVLNPTMDMPDNPFSPGRLP